MFKRLVMYRLNANSVSSVTLSTNSQPLLLDRLKSLGVNTIDAEELECFEVKVTVD